MRDLDDPKFPQGHAEPAASAGGTQGGDAGSNERLSHGAVTRLLCDQSLHAELRPHVEDPIGIIGGDSAGDLFRFDVVCHRTGEVTLGERQVAARLQRVPDQARVITGAGQVQCFID